MTTDERVEALADLLESTGRLVEPGWRDGLRAVPRHLFAPDRGWAVPDRPVYEGFAIDRHADPMLWWEAVYTDTAIAIQLDDGAGDPMSGSGLWTSSCSAPGIVVIFLQELRALDHHRVLEIGTGTGWTSGLLTWRLGQGQVTSVEIDESLSMEAGRRLQAAGLSPHLVVGDGAEGFAAGAPYDRVHVTCGVETVPHAWVEQTRPGGGIVLPWSPGWGIGHLAHLAVAGDGTALGHLTGPAGFMMLRSQRRPFGGPEQAAEQRSKADRSTTRLDPRSLIAESPGAEVAIAALVPGVRSHLEAAPDGSLLVWAIESRDDDPAWACAEFEPGRADFTVLQYGERRVWDEVQAAYLAWVGWGRPARERFGLTVSAGGQSVWLDDPSRSLG